MVVPDAFKHKPSEDEMLPREFAELLYKWHSSQQAASSAVASQPHVIQIFGEGGLHVPCILGRQMHGHTHTRAHTGHTHRRCPPADYASARGSAVMFQGKSYLQAKHIRVCMYIHTLVGVYVHPYHSPLSRRSYANSVHVCT